MTKQAIFNFASSESSDQLVHLSNQICLHCQHHERIGFTYTEGTVQTDYTG